ncbi:MAG TPA: ArsR family transcriptional regulator [Dehalococcoidia bacterium]|nr:ArsR family transcriptional regulator [Dehalococcoidia bacterium]
MKSTRDLTLELLRRHGELTVAELGKQLGIAGPAVRRHLDILAGEGLVEYRAVRQHTGRPYFVYRLTDEAKARAADGYSRLVERLIREVSDLDDGAGHALLDTLLARLGERLAEEHRGEVSGETLQERAASLIAALSDEGILDGVEVRDDGMHLINTACPHRRAALASDAVCRYEQHAIALLLDAPVAQVGRIVDGQSRCDYLVCEPGRSTVTSVV